ncbi:P-type conjugative transfer protein TrbJ [Phenylobacterium sp. LjRoot225]|uniref:P-type conjugative transfer protein TrbJ n=1 Tax=Phenylobacterium sp. LjRoot225 TaxID=3342285 RepID=UPI003ECEC31D
MSRKSWLAVTAAALILTAPLQASAFVVFDPSNYAQNVMTAARSLQQITNQITMLQNQAQMLLNGARNLTSLNFSALAQLKANLARTQSLITQARGLAFDVASLDQKFKQLYPSGYAAGTTGATLAGDAQSRWTASLEALRTTMQVQAQVSDQITADQGTLSDISSRSASAIGVLQAVQATNELLALQAKQAMQGQQLALAQDRAAASEAARGLAADARAQAVRSQFVGTPSAYAPLPVKAF